MMKNVLIAYTTDNGSTEQVAQVIGEELGQLGLQAQVYRLEKVDDIAGYDAVVVGAPMIMGWHRSAITFIKRHQKALSAKPVAYFFVAMNLTHPIESRLKTTPIFVDPLLAKPPQKAGHLSWKERYATVDNYLGAALKAAPQVAPVSAGFFGGRLDLFRLNLWAKLFVLLIIQAAPGNKLNPSAVREWARSLPDVWK